MRKTAGVVVAAFSLAVVWLVMTPAAYADDWDKATKITINQPMEIPGVVLPAGTYIVKIVDLLGERHVVRFLSEDGTKIYATLIGIPDFRLEPTDKTAMTFYEAEQSRPSALRSWFYPGHRLGIEFAYPKTRAFEIASAVAEPVVAFEEPETVAGEPSVRELLEEPLIGVTPGGEEVAVAELRDFAMPPEPELGEEYALPLPVLPRTATPFPLIAFIGVLAAAGASVLRRLR